MLDWIRLPVGLLQTNAYVVYNKKGRCLIVDPGGEEKKIHQFVQKKKLKPQAVLLTHAHFDHIGAVDILREQYSIPVYIHQKEKKWLSNPLLNGSEKYEDVEPVVIKDADHLFSKEEKTAIDGFTFHVLATARNPRGDAARRSMRSESMVCSFHPRSRPFQSPRNIATVLSRPATITAACASSRATP